MIALVDVALAEWESIQPSDTPRGRLLQGVWLDDPRAVRLAEDLSRARILHVEERRAGLFVGATSFVGRIQLGRVRVTVEPKIAREPLLRLFRYAYGLRRLMLFGASTADAGTLFQDVLLHQLRAEVDELRRRGLLHRYVARSEDLASPRGRVDIDRLATRGGMIAATLPCRHSPRTIDHLLNRVIAAGVALGVRLAHAPALRQDLLTLDRMLGEPPLGRVHLDRDLLRIARASISRLSSAYEPTLKVIELLVEGMSIELDDGEALAIPGFLFDMNRFFQALVERLLVDHLTEHEVRSEVGLAGMMRYVQNPRNRRAPQPRPDLTIRTKKTGAVSLLDAKYRDLWEKPLPREMLYQLALYAMSQREAPSAAMIFPTDAQHATEAVVEVCDPVGRGRLATVKLRPLHVETLAAALDDENGIATLTAIAHRLAFG